MTVPSINLIYPKSEAFASSGTWTRPSSSIQWADVLLVGGGGGGGGGDSDQSGAGGGGGGGEIKRCRMRVTGDITVTIGAGGAGGASGISPDDGIDGSASTLASGCVLSSAGGKKGLGGAGVNDAQGGDGGGLMRWTPRSDGSLDGSVHYWPATGNNGCSPGGCGGKANISEGNQYMASGVPSYSSSGTTTAATGGGGGGSYGDGANGANGAGNAAAANTGGGGAGGKGGDNAGGAGGSGYCIIFWIEP